MNWTTPAMFGDVFDRLERDNVRYVTVSGIAVVLHGHIRPVGDLDIVIDAAPHEASRAMHALMLAGFVPSLPLPLSALTVLRMFDSAQREIDVFVRYRIPFDELWASSERVRVGASTTRVASLEHLLRAKQITGRPHDLLDIEGLLALKAPGRNGITDAPGDAPPEGGERSNVMNKPSALGKAHLRIVRPSDDLAANVMFYRDGLGFEVLYEFKDHDGFDAMMLGHQEAAYHLAFVHKIGHEAGRAPSEDNLLVFYLPDAGEWTRSVARLVELGHEPVKAFNPYWDKQGKTFEDPDGYRVVLQHASWPA